MFCGTLPPRLLLSGILFKSDRNPDLIRKNIWVFNMGLVLSRFRTKSEEKTSRKRIAFVASRRVPTSQQCSGAQNNQELNANKLSDQVVGCASEQQHRTQRPSYQFLYKRGKKLFSPFWETRENRGRVLLFIECAAECGFSERFRQLSKKMDKTRACSDAANKDIQQFWAQIAHIVFPHLRF